MGNLVLGDCIKIMSYMDDESVDLTVTSPPYDDLRGYNSNIDFREVANQLYRITKPGGVVVWNVNDKIENGTKSLTSFKQCIMFNEIGFNVNDVMIWEKSNPMPQVKQPRYNQVFEYMFIFSKGKPKTFNPIMVECKSKGKEYKSTAKKITNDKEREYKEFTINNYKVDNNIWKMSVAQNKTNHPAVFPIELPLRHIQTWTNVGDTVLDPFMGSGTTGIACRELKRNFIGIEIDAEYYKLAKGMIENEHYLEYMKQVTVDENKKLKQIKLF